MSEGMKSSKGTDPELTFPTIDPTLLDTHKMRQIERERKTGTLTGIQDTRTNIVAVLDNPVTRVLRLISERCKTGEELLNALERAEATCEITIQYSRNWEFIRYNAKNKKEMLGYLDSCIVQNISESKKIAQQYQQDGFKVSYFQVLMCIQDFYQKLPD